MHRTRTGGLLLFSLLVLGCSTLHPASVQTADESDAIGAVGPVGVMTFNIRYGTASDGPNHWRHRREAVVGLIDRLGEDFVGLQEALRFQIDEIVSGVPRYAFVGVGRDDGVDAGEFCAILYDTRTWKVDSEHSGTFWLSDTPEVVASTSWGNGITRIATYARFERVDEGEPKAVWIFNTHWDHRSQPSRERSAALIAQRIADRANPDEPVVLMGDFNAGEANAAMAYLRGEAEVQSERTPAPLVDCFRVAHPGATEVGTFCGFDPARTGGEKIDAVLVEPGARVLDAAIVRESVPGEVGRAPSDHFPVTARLAWSNATETVRTAYHAVLDAAAGAQARVKAEHGRAPWGPAGVLRQPDFDAPAAGPLLDEYGLDRETFESEVAITRSAAAALREAGVVQKLAKLTGAVEALGDDAVLDLSGTLDRRARDAYRMLACLAVDAELAGHGGDAPAGGDAYTTVIAGLDAMARAQLHGAGDDAALSNMVLLRFTDGLVLDAIAAGHMTEDRARALLGSARVATDAQRERYLGIVSRQLSPQNRQTMANYWHTTRDGRRLALAIEVYRGQHGGPPPTLDALTPGVLADTPRDPWARGERDGKYVYRLDDASPLGYVLYSVGADGVDDGGVRDGPMLSPDAGTDRLLAPGG